MQKLMPKRHFSGHSLQAIFKFLFLLLLGLLPLYSVGGAGALVSDLQYVFKSGEYLKVARLASLSAKDLRYASRVENITGLLELAQQENRIDPIQMMRLSKLYASVADGDGLLLVCLRNISCQPEKFTEIVNTSRLHAEVIKRNPALSLVQTHHLVGALNENLMIRYFEQSGWTRVEGQVGRTGFDGLFVKYNEGVIKDVLIVESKYNTSSLQSTNFGVQMSEDWIRRKMVELKQRFPNQNIYQRIDRFIETGAYRAVLWNLKVEVDELKIRISKIKSKGGLVDVAIAEGTDVGTLASPFANSVSLKAPRNSFESQVLSWYNDELTAVGILSSR